VVSSRIQLTKAGHDLKARCPFHDERTPSFTVSPAKQFFHCFGCGAHGTAVGFLMDYEHLDFPEAIEELAGMAGVEVPREDAPQRGPDNTPIYEVLERAARWYQRQLREHPDGPRAVAYLKRRGLTGEVASRFGIGFAPPGWSNLLEALGASAGEALLERAGLAIHRDSGGRYDRFRNRVMFPIVDRRGRTIAFGGRVLDDDTPKYLNSPETAVFHKGRELYGLYQARRAGSRLERLVVVEGYMDVVALAQAGFENAVATLGTAATSEHVELLFRTCPDVVFCFDGDEAGRRAAWRALETTLAAMRDGRQAFFMFLPEGEDPDSLVRARGPGAFREALDSAASLGTVLFEHLADQVDMSTIDGRARLTELARPLLGRIPPGTFRDLAATHLGELTGLPSPLPGARDSSTLTPGGGGPTPGHTRRARPGQGRASTTPVRRAVTLMLHHPRLADGVKDPSAIAQAGEAGCELLAGLVEAVRDRPDISTAALVERFRGESTGRHLARLATEEVPELSDGLRAEFDDCVGRILDSAGNRRFGDLLAKVRAGEASEAEQREFARLSTRAARRGSPAT
jgi:DNA primase